MNKVNPRVDAYLREADQWQQETKKLSMIALERGLTEALKWGKPCYALEESNILIIQVFKEYCALMFCQGAWLKDPQRLLKKPGENTQAARQIRFTQVRETVKLEPVLKTAFGALTPGRQRAYILYFSAAKQSETRESRIAKCLPHILKGKGLND